LTSYTEDKASDSTLSSLSTFHPMPIVLSYG
jgi:hypothetical protein